MGGISSTLPRVDSRLSHVSFTSVDSCSSPAISGRLRITETPTPIGSPRIGKSPSSSPNSFAAGNGTAIARPSSLTNLVELRESSPLLGRAKVGRSTGTHLIEPPRGVVYDSPPLVVWIGPALSCAFAYALYNIFIKKGSASINPVLGGVVLQLVAAILGCVLLAMLVLKEGVKELHFDRDGIYWSTWAGVAVGGAEMLSFCVSGMGVQVTQSIPVLIGGSVLFGSLLGVAWLREVMTIQGWFGVLLLVVGIGLVATDPGQYSKQ